MISFDEIGTMLDDIVDDLPEDFYSNLNGGVYLLPDVKIHPQSKENNDLYILGEYHSKPSLGNYIDIFYGSFVKVYSYLSAIQQKDKLREIILHEFTHHFEIMAGEKGLEIKDSKDLEEYLNL